MLHNITILLKLGFQASVFAFLAFFNTGPVAFIGAVVIAFLG
jgi:hypothetical protein